MGTESVTFYVQTPSLDSAKTAAEALKQFSTITASLQDRIITVTVEGPSARIVADEIIDNMRQKPNFTVSYENPQQPASSRAPRRRQPRRPGRPVRWDPPPEGARGGKAILLLIIQNGPITTRQAGFALNIERSGAYNTIRGLIREGLVAEARSSGPEILYDVTAAGAQQAATYKPRRGKKLHWHKRTRRLTLVLRLMITSPPLTVRQIQERINLKESDVRAVLGPGKRFGLFKLLYDTYPARYELTDEGRHNAERYLQTLPSEGTEGEEKE